jgi:replication factor C subunit 1
MDYNSMKQGITRIEKDKVLRQNPFDACQQILAGNKTPWNERYNAFFIDYSLLPLLLQQNYIDAAKSGIFRNPQLDDCSKMEALVRASEAVSDVDMLGAMIRGQDQHWELLPAQSALCMAIGQPIQGFQAFPTFPAVYTLFCISRTL